MSLNQWAPIITRGVAKTTTMAYELKNERREK